MLLCTSVKSVLTANLYKIFCIICLYYQNKIFYMVGVLCTIVLCAESERVWRRIQASSAEGFCVSSSDPVWAKPALLIKKNTVYIHQANIISHALSCSMLSVDFYL
ncbi:hypothetical protein KFK09_005634 [Dendrobium nobile]|uniref:Uncharacterized protein n=1 Tax=Dendrobium nobile TaxID=94219 RepID=A0A8T3BW78_DENNO|nr:hypothetical protein KFK09_005634 [Dendrobium nobile]